MPALPTGWARVAIGLTSALALAGCLALAVVGPYLGWVGTCDGDGGYPYAARASLAGRMCTSTAGDAYAYAQVGLPVLVMLALGTYAVVKARWSRVLIGVVASIAVTVAMLVVLGSLPSSCTSEQRRTLDPYECEAYSSP